MRSIATSRSTALLALVALALCAAPTARAQQPEAAGASAAEGAPAPSERKPWDQARMQDLSSQLVTALSEVRKAYRREPSYRDPSNPNRRASQNMDQILKSLETSARQLAAKVKAGGGYEDTLGVARKIGQLLNDAEVEGRKLMTSEWMQQRVVPAKQLLNEIAPYYGRGPLYDPETMKRID